MKFIIDHDYHIHTYLSWCSGDESQTPENIIKYAEKNGLKEVVITDHFWDKRASEVKDFPWYEKQDLEHIKRNLPLPKSDKVKIYFGGETDMDKALNLGADKNTFDTLDFLIIPTTHLHMAGFTIDEGATKEDRAEAYFTRLDRVLDLDLPFNKVGIAHLTCPLICQGEIEEHLQVLDLVSDEVFFELFSKIKQKGAGVELNFKIANYEGENLTRVLRPYKIAKEVGCKFYLGSDSHNKEHLKVAKANFEKIIDALSLTEEDKFIFSR